MKTESGLDKVKEEKVSKQIENKINPFPKEKCPKCGGNIMIVFGVAICDSCNYRQDLYVKEVL